MINTNVQDNSRIAQTRKPSQDTYLSLIRAITTHNIIEKSNSKSGGDVKNHLRRRLIRLLFWPIAMIIFMVGWVMLVVASRKQLKNQPACTVETSQDDLITIMPMIPE